jgi:hypothetical protein
MRQRARLDSAVTLRSWPNRVAAAETQSALENARLLIEKAEQRGEPPEDPLILFSILYGFWGVSFQRFNREAVYNLAAQFLALARNRTTA